MIQIRILDEKTISPEEYNKQATHPLQSWEWGEARKEMGLEIIRIGEYKNNSLTNVFLATIHPIPKTPFRIVYIPRSRLPSKHLLDFLKEYCREKKVVFIKFEPNIKANDVGKKDIPSELKESSHPLFPLWTQTLDISPSVDELMKTMKPKTRYNVRLSQKKGVIVTEESNEKGFKTFVKMYFDTCKRQRYYGHTKAYHNTVWKHLKNSISHILIARLGTEPLAAYELFLFNNVLYYPYGGSSTDHKSVMAPNAMMWEAILFGKKNGAHMFDMWGSTGPKYSTNDSHAGFTRFKEGYGTHFTKMAGSYDLVLHQPAYFVYGIVYRVRNWILNTF